jgi:peptidoglycan hydrolase CwlO-like protein
MPNNTGEFATRVAALRQRLEAAQQRLAGVAQQQNGLLEALARNELEQQKERIGTYQIQARFALASIYDRAAAPPSAAPKEAAPPQESQGELEIVPSDPSSSPDGAPLDGAAPPPADQPVPDAAPPPDQTGPPPAEAPK